MKHMAWSVLAVLLVLPVARTQESPKDSAKEQYQTLLKEFNEQRTKIRNEAQQAEGEEQQKLIAQFRALGPTYAEKFFKLAEANPQDPIALDAYFWIVQNGSGSTVLTPAVDKVKAAVATLPLAELNRRLRTIRHIALIEVVFKRAEKEPQAAETPDLLGWVASSGSTTPFGLKALDLLVAKNADHPTIEQACMAQARSRTAAQAAPTLQRVLDTAKKPNIRAAAALALGQIKLAELDALGDKPAEAEKAEKAAEKYFTMVVEEFGADAPRLKPLAERSLKELHSPIRVGKEAPEIAASDLDGKEFKLSDYRGKVVLLDFWGNW